MKQNPIAYFFTLAVQLLLLLCVLASPANAVNSGKTALGGSQPSTTVALENIVGKSLSILDIFLDFKTKALGCCVGPDDTLAKDIQSKQLEVGKVESYKDSKKITGDGSVHRDHQPSVQSLLTRAEEIKGSALTKAQKRAISENATTVTVPSNIHVAGPTYGGKNTPLLQNLDANDLQSAAIRDSNAMVKNAKTMSPDDVPALLKACEGINCTTNTQYDDFLKKMLAKKKKVTTKKANP